MLNQSENKISPQLKFYYRNREEVLLQKRCFYKKNRVVLLKRHSDWIKNNKWYITYSNILKRCNSINNVSYKWYGGKGIKCLLTPRNVKFLWKRDKAQLMKQPSIDRIDSNKNYTLENCRFIEMNVNRTKRLYTKRLRNSKGQYIKTLSVQ